MTNQPLGATPTPLAFFELTPGRWVLAATARAADPATRLEFVVHVDSIEIQQINVHPDERGQHVALGMVKRIADRYPDKRVWFSGTNALSRALARRCEQVIDNFDADVDVQERYRASDEAAGLYDAHHVDVREWQINDLMANGLDRESAESLTNRW